MKLMAVICEYNPFHNGHAYQLAQQKEALGCDGVIGLMSGSFVQRGEPALLDKWARSEMALACGCDLVLELPVVYSLQSAEGFARGAVSLLAALGLEAYLAFGSECGEADKLTAAAEVCLSPAYHEALQASLAEGNSYPRACQLALAALLPEGADEVAGCPNDILGIEYSKAIKTTGAKLTPAVIRRRGAHDSMEPDAEFLSATGIRSRLAAGQDVSPYMPPTAFLVLQREINAGRGPVTAAGLDMLIRYALQRISRMELQNISGISEGLEKRLQDAAAVCSSFSEMAQKAKTKRYPQTRLQRAMLNILLGITKDDEKIEPCYGRIVGIGPRGGAILRSLKKTTNIPLITKTADAHLSSKNAERMFRLDCRATDVYSLLYPQKKAGKSGMDFYRSPVLWPTE